MNPRSVRPRVFAKFPAPDLTIKSLQDEYVFPIQFDFIDTDLVVSSFFELVARYGFLARRQTAKSFEDYDKFLDNFLAENFVSESLDSPPLTPVREVLNGWIIWNLLVPKKRGKGRDKGDEIRFVRPVTPGVIRSGLPMGINNIRYADVWLYRLALDFLRISDNAIDQPHRRTDIAKLLLEGSGIEMSGDAGSCEPRYDGFTELDINARLVLEFLKSFTDAVSPDSKVNHGEVFPTEPWNSESRGKAKSPSGIRKQPVLEIHNGMMHPLEALTLVPGAFLPMGQVAVISLRQYQAGHQSAQLAEQLSGLLRVSLLQSPIRVARALRQFLLDPEAPAAGDLLPYGLINEQPGRLSPNPTEMFCDFTNGIDPRVVELSKKCVSRDLHWHHQLLRDRLYVRALAMVQEFLQLQDPIPLWIWGFLVQ